MVGMYVFLSNFPRLANAVHDRLPRFHGLAPACVDLSSGAISHHCRGEEASGDTTVLTQKRCRCIDKHANVALHARQPLSFYVTFLGHLLEAVAQTSWDDSLGDRRGRWFFSLLTRFFLFFFFAF